LPVTSTCTPPHGRMPCWLRRSVFSEKPVIRYGSDGSPARTAVSSRRLPRALPICKVVGDAKPDGVLPSSIARGGRWPPASRAHREDREPRQSSSRRCRGWWRWTIMAIPPRCLTQFVEDAAASKRSRSVLTSRSTRTAPRWTGRRRPLGTAIAAALVGVDDGRVIRAKTSWAPARFDDIQAPDRGRAVRHAGWVELVQASAEECRSVRLPCPAPRAATPHPPRPPTAAAREMAPRPRAAIDVGVLENAVAPGHPCPARRAPRRRDRCSEHDRHIATRGTLTLRRRVHCHSRPDRPRT